MKIKRSYRDILVRNILLTFFLLYASISAAALVQYHDNVGSVIEYEPFPGISDTYYFKNVTNAYYIEIGGAYYDISYDGSFGDIGFFEGNKDAAFEAGQVTLNVLGSVTVSHADWQVYYDIDSFFSYRCAAGCFYNGDSDLYPIINDSVFRSHPVGFRLSEGPIFLAPVPAAGWLFGTGLIGLIGFARRKKA